MLITTRRLSDSAEVCQASSLFRNAYAEAPWYETWTELAAHERLLELAGMPGRIAVGAYVESRMIGITVGFTQSNVRGKSLYIAEVVVEPYYQAKGVGRRLLEVMQQEAKAEGHVGAWLVTRGEGRTAEFYRKLDFTQSESLRIFNLML
ncbi:GNAT family N-acetyltransferase [Peteryoungia desertarenae]|uniref:GNAT family N-acetyltransferase n=1 Tax=Peteryoungia desertarenae TaxID=1813451 RepID=A0ABX6QQX1_9HYPH|nr:GNAT family N-acetyltransferase [Peteryoungia desertarenae]QLF70607.1 GNAT family N-acetyltransferase [Peteryoungia desertarenae]